MLGGDNGGDKVANTEPTLPVPENEIFSSVTSDAQLSPVVLQSEDTAAEKIEVANEDEESKPGLLVEKVEPIEFETDRNVGEHVNENTCEAEVSSECSAILAVAQETDEVLLETTADDDQLESEKADKGNEIDMDTENVADVVEDMGTEETETARYYYWNYELDFEECNPKCLISTSIDEAPDGSCLLSNADDDNLRLFNIPSSFSSIQDWNSDLPILESEEWCSTLKVKEGGLVYDYCWYPLMSSMDPVTNVTSFLTSSSESPVHLWDAFSGRLRASYQPFNHLEQLISAYSLAFDPSGENIYCGFEKSVRIFNITRPGRQCIERSLKQGFPGLSQFGKVACLAVNPAHKSIYAVGSFDKTIGLYCDDGSVICLLQGHLGGVTHMKFSSDGLKLFTGGRNDSRLICWDMRNMGEEYQIFKREVTTHQRMYFDITPNGRYLVSGGTDGVVRIWDMLKEEDQPFMFKGNSDCVNGISLNPYIPLLATSSGQRHFMEIAEDSDDELFVKSQSSLNRSCDIKLWKVP
ncbi:Telomerase Cajal body protein 1 [Orchesella cincta]|uniref:WD repeat-containing protein 79 n=1 Tax=Orchesella cincta TaxID=48709 RepID=A0A1D2N8J0_ORCCI|nr:Telomerase Cajal body protein 1 [Orchesella cincta]